MKGVLTDKRERRDRQTATGGESERRERESGRHEKMKDEVASRNVKCSLSVCTEYGIYG